MKTFIKAKLKKSDDQTNIELLQILQNIIYVYVKMSNMFEMDVRTFW